MRELVDGAVVRPEVEDDVDQEGGGHGHDAALLQGSDLLLAGPLDGRLEPEEKRRKSEAAFHGVIQDRRQHVNPLLVGL